MTSTPTDPLSSWLQWLERLQGENGEAGKLWQSPPWQVVLNESVEILANALARSSHWQRTFEAQIEEAAKAAAAAAEHLGTQLPPDIAWLSQLFSLDRGNANRHGGTLADGLFCNFAAWPALGLAAGNDNQWHAFQQAMPRARTAMHGCAERLKLMLLQALRQWQASILAATDSPATAELLHEQWLLALEQAWQDTLGDPEHARCLLEYNEAMESLRERGAPIADGLFHALGLPTREDLLGTQRRLQQLRRKLRGMGPSPDFASLQDDITFLRREVADLRMQLDASNTSGKPH